MPLLAHVFIMQWFSGCLDVFTPKFRQKFFLIFTFWWIKTNVTYKTWSDHSNKVVHYNLSFSTVSNWFVTMYHRLLHSVSSSSKHGCQQSNLLLLYSLQGCERPFYKKEENRQKQGKHHEIGVKRPKMGWKWIKKLKFLHMKIFKKEEISLKEELSHPCLYLCPYLLSYIKFYGCVLCQYMRIESFSLNVIWDGESHPQILAILSVWDLWFKSIKVLRE